MKQKKLTKENSILYNSDMFIFLSVRCMFFYCCENVPEILPNVNIYNIYTDIFSKVIKQCPENFSERNLFWFHFSPPILSFSLSLAGVRCKNVWSFSKRCENAQFVYLI